MSQDISKMETAKDIFDRIVGKHHRELSPMNYENTMKFAQEIADKAWEAGRNREHERWTAFPGQPKFPNKETFMKSLFPDTK